MNDELDQLLKPRKYLDDAGFTNQVLAALPPRKAPGRARAMILGVAALASTVALLVGPARVLLTSGFSIPTLVALAFTVVVFAGTAASMALREAERF
jgi:hypothetical protein